MQASKCEEFHYQNDFKLNILKNFFADHIPKHLAAYEYCWKNPEFENLSTVEEKDRTFLACHENWINNIRSNLKDELSSRVKELLVSK